MDAAPSTPTAIPSTFRPIADPHEMGQELGQSSLYLDAVAGPDGTLIMIHNYVYT